MAVQLTPQSFHQLLARSGLLQPDSIRKLAERFPAEAANPEKFAGLLMTKRLLTKWQADKLLLGKHRGFFLGPYQLKSHLARGGMSTLYVAEHTETGEVHALKVLPPSRAAEASYLPRFLREAELAARLHHPNVMRVFDILSFTDAGQTVHFMVMELLNGRDLFNDVFQRGPLPLMDACEIIRQSANGLQYAHDAGLVHRDIKPGNLFITDEGTVKIVDLGLAAILEGQAESLTREYDERVLGTADYLAPEQAVDSHTVDGRADIYALGCAFYFALSGRPPFVDGNLAQRILAHQTKEPQDIATIRADVPPEIQQLLKSMLKKKRTERIQTCAEIADQLTGWLDAHGEIARYQQKPELVEPGDSADSEPRKLKRLAPKKSEAETPTDSIVAAETATTASSGTQSKSTAPTEQNSSVWQSEGVQYSEAFECFLERLDNESGVASVMDENFRRGQRRAMSHLQEDVASMDVVTVSSDEHSATAVDNSKAKNRTATPAGGLKFASIVLVLLAVGISVIALTVGRPWAEQSLRFMKQVWRSAVGS
ncbi:serine/threonine-protein kinase [Fuerstiella marisgermanici]|uniref:Serine/threonine-protein kinase PknB n=1 Tax=Fuerstiella marisgermanici TaxID=1891926 RepID=A0A1P8WR61_9PLAN|nr:serine/threonine-protein kinase [Fuerstiella marisgermanici]APZ96550.1 Serine/threonine-protein kinase PknB [Fuerstiella marisgermanici]